MTGSWGCRWWDCGDDGFDAAVGESEVDGGDGAAEEFVGSGVGGRCVRRHAEAVVIAVGADDGFELLVFWWMLAAERHHQA